MAQLTPVDAEALLQNELARAVRTAELAAPRYAPEEGSEGEEAPPDPHWAQVDHFYSNLQARAAKAAAGGAAGGAKARGTGKRGGAAGRPRGAMKGARAAAAAAADAADAQAPDAEGWRARKVRRLGSATRVSLCRVAPQSVLATWSRALLRWRLQSPAARRTAKVAAPHSEEEEEEREPEAGGGDAELDHVPSQALSEDAQLPQGRRRAGAAGAGGGAGARRQRSSQLPPVLPTPAASDDEHDDEEEEEVHVEEEEPRHAEEHEDVREEDEAAVGGGAMMVRFAAVADEPEPSQGTQLTDLPPRRLKRHRV